MREPAPTIAIYTLDDLLTDLDNNLAELAACCPSEALTPMEVETAPCVPAASRLPQYGLANACSPASMAPTPFRTPSPI